jgi:hypothetical protein
MSTYWQKPAYLPSDRHPTTGEILPGALAPGLYCENEAALAKLRRGAFIRSQSMLPTLAGHWRLNGQDVFLCTPEQAKFFRATASKAPPEQPEPTVDVAGMMKPLLDRLEADLAARDQAPPVTARVTRQQRRAAERARRRA